MSLVLNDAGAERRLNIATKDIDKFLFAFADLARKSIEHKYGHRTNKSHYPCDDFRIRLLSNGGDSGSEYELGLSIAVSILGGAWVNLLVPVARVAEFESEIKRAINPDPNVAVLGKWD